MESALIITFLWMTQTSRRIPRIFSRLTGLNWLRFALPMKYS